MSSILHHHFKYLFLIDHHLKPCDPCQKLLTMSGSPGCSGRSRTKDGMCDADSPQSIERDVDVVIPASAAADGHTQDMVGKNHRKKNV